MCSKGIRETLGATSTNLVLRIGCCGSDAYVIDSLDDETNPRVISSSTACTLLIPYCKTYETDTTHEMNPRSRWHNDAAGKNTGSQLYP